MVYTAATEGIDSHIVPGNQEKCGIELSFRQQSECHDRAVLSPWTVHNGTEERSTGSRVIHT